MRYKYILNVLSQRTKKLKSDKFTRVDKELVSLHGNSHMIEPKKRVKLLIILYL